MLFFAGILLALAALIYALWRLVQARMSPMRKFSTVLVVSLAAYLLWFLAFPWTPVWYRLTFDIETPEGVKSASGVRLVYDWKQPKIAVPSSGGGSGAGEAIPIDLDNRGVLFALVAPRNPDGTPGNSPVSVPLDAIYNRLKGDWPRGIKRLRELDGAIELKPDETPFLVRFRDINDPKTVEAVDPQDLAARFGEGIRLKRATLEFVSFGIWPLYLFGIPGAQVTTGIEKRLGWLPKVTKGSLDGSILQYRDARASLSNTLHHGDFVRK